MRVKILNRKILECQTFRIWKLMNVKKIDKFVNFPNCEIPKVSEIVQFRKFVKLSKFQKPRIQLIIYHICILSVCRIKKKRKNKKQIQK